MNKNKLEKYLNANTIDSMLGLGKNGFLKLVKEGKAPEGVRISERIIRWPENTILEWLKELEGVNQNTNYQ